MKNEENQADVSLLEIQQMTVNNAVRQQENRQAIACPCISTDTRSQAVIYLPSCPQQLHCRNPAPKIKLPGGITPCMGHGLGVLAVGCELLVFGEAALGSEGATEHQ